MVVPLNRLSLRIVDPSNDLVPSYGNNPKLVGNRPDQTFQAHVWLRNDGIIPISLSHVTFKTIITQGTAIVYDSKTEIFEFEINSAGAEREFLGMVVCPLSNIIVDGAGEVKVEAIFEGEVLAYTRVFFQINNTDLYLLDEMGMIQRRLSAAEDRIKALESNKH